MAADTTLCNPMKELAGRGRNAKAVKGCTELFLGNRGLRRLEGFDKLRNLEVMFVNANQLERVTGLEGNFRLRELYVHDNKLTSLEGSIPGLKFLQHLDASGNQLRDLAAVLAHLAPLRDLTSLNLQGNPCAEEPGYRLQVIAAMRSLEVLDLHMVTGAERRQAAAELGGGGLAASIAFGRTTDAWDPRACRVQERSVLEQELAQTVAVIRDKRLAEQEATERALYADNPSEAFYTCKSMPAPLPLAASAGVSTLAASATSSAMLGGKTGAAAPPAVRPYRVRDSFVLHSVRRQGDMLPAGTLPAHCRLETTLAGTVPRYATGFTPSCWQLGTRTLKL